MKKLSIFLKRGKYCVREDNGKLHKFNSQKEAEAFVGIENEEVIEIEEVVEVEDRVAEEIVFHNEAIGGFQDDEEEPSY